MYTTDVCCELCLPADRRWTDTSRQGYATSIARERHHSRYSNLLALLIRVSRFFFICFNAFDVRFSMKRIVSTIFFFLVDPTGNNHDATELQEVVPDQSQDGGDADDEAGFKVKQRSILQAKLTKLAIQIGYAGTVVSDSEWR
jgi:hypothetical protein